MTLQYIVNLQNRRTPTTTNEVSKIFILFFHNRSRFLLYAVSLSFMQIHRSSTAARKTLATGTSVLRLESRSGLVNGVPHGMLIPSSFEIRSRSWAHQLKRKQNHYKDITSGMYCLRRIKQHHRDGLRVRLTSRWKVLRAGVVDAK